jgi:UDP-glucose 4-epimerase
VRGVRVLVTGGAGYIGSISVRMLADAGHDVIVLDTLENGYAAAVDPRASLVIGDVGDPCAVERALADADAVLHCAGYIDVAESVREPEHYRANNSAKPMVLLDSMEAAGVRAIVFSSTAAVYGAPVSVPIPEDADCVPVNPYGDSKLAFERELARRGEAAGDDVGASATREALHSVSLRYFNASGALADASLGEAHDPETHIIPRVLRAMAAGERTFEVFGDDYPTPDGTCVRDYIHVCDLGAAHMRALERAHARARGEGAPRGDALAAAAPAAADAPAPSAAEVFNLGNGRGYSNLEVVRMCAEVTGCDVDVRFGPRREGDPPVLVASNERALRELGWRPERGDLRVIVEDAWRWHSAHPGGYASGG